MSRNAQGSGNALNHDAFAWKLAEHLLEDFQPFMRDVVHSAAKSALADRNVSAWRLLACGDFGSYKPFTLKTTRQVVDLFKKFSFSRDVMTPSQLQEDSKRKFLDNQKRLMAFAIDDGSPEVRNVISRARGWASHILGDHSSMEVCERATFGKKSSVGVPMRKACEGQRYEAPITGSDDHIDWFAKYYKQYNRPAFNYACEVAEKGNLPPFRSIDILEAVLVPKTWKSLRMIMPNTTLGTLYSSGIGRVIEERLRRFGYDIKHLQPVHGELARIGSITGSLVTADQSMASDNITVDLVDRILPRRWASALSFGRISRISLYGETVDSPTYATMGIGFTFPLQTLLFLVLLLAIRDECGLDESTVVSVFGDDLIYAAEMHDLVVRVFPKLGLVLNLDKTFAEGHFRESCGQDYFHGIDVRPFHLGEAGGSCAYGRKAEAYLYKTLNGLLRRWSVEEIPVTIRMIWESIAALRGRDPLIVPWDYPDTSGMKYDPEVILWLDIPKPGRRDVHGTLHFRYLAFEPNERSETRHVPYLIARLRTVSPVERLPYPVKGHGDVLREATPMFNWVKDPTRGSSRSETTGKRYRRLLPVIPHQDDGRYRERSGVSSNWTP